MKKLILPLVILATLSSCVSSKKYKALQQERDRENTARLGSERQVADLQRLVSVLEADTSRLAQDLRKSRKRYQDLLSESTDKNQNLSQQLAQQTQELRKKEQQLARTEAELEARETRVRELSSIIRRQDSISSALLNKVQAALINFNDDELTVEQKDGKVYVSLSDQLLFQSGSANVNSKGRAALIKIAEVLNKNPEIRINIQGHTDDVPIQTSKFTDNWDLSVLRATSVVRILVWSGKVDPTRLEPSGRSRYEPLVENTSRENRSKNRRTEIILEPDLSELFSLLQSK